MKCFWKKAFYHNSNSLLIVYKVEIISSGDDSWYDRSIRHEQDTLNQNMNLDWDWTQMGSGYKIVRLWKRLLNGLIRVYGAQFIGKLVEFVNTRPIYNSFEELDRYILLVSYCLNKIFYFLFGLVGRSYVIRIVNKLSHRVSGQVNQLF